jgi:Gpi18-like mannosyltransferase
MLSLVGGRMTVASPSIAPHAPTPIQRDTLPALAWCDAFAVWLGQRAMLLALIWVFQSITSQPSPQSILRLWTLWDVRLYAEIARGGYQHPAQAAFFPLFPLLEHLLAPLTGGNVEVAGAIVANAASLGAFLLLRLLVERDLGLRVARRTLLYLALFPTSFFLADGYSESLFLFLAVATFVALRQRRWLLAGLLAALATLTRVTGLLLLLPLACAAVEAHRASWRLYTARQRLRAALTVAVGVAAPVVAYAGLQVALWLRFGVWDAPGRAEGVWGRSLDWPWVGLLRSLEMVATQWPSVAGMDLAFAMLWLALACSMLLPSRQPLPAGYVAYTWGSLLLVLSVPAHHADLSPLMSISRFLLVVFPCFVRLAQWSTHARWVHGVLLAASVCQSAALIWIFARGTFVA